MDIMNKDKASNRNESKPYTELSAAVRAARIELAGIIVALTEVLETVAVRRFLTLPKFSVANVFIHLFIDMW